MNIIKKYFVHLANKKLSEKFVSAQHVGDIITLEFADGSQKKYVGDCTVWHELPYMKRAATSSELFFSEIEEYVQRYGNPYPTAHKKPDKSHLI